MTAHDILNTLLTEGWTLTPVGADHVVLTLPMWESLPCGYRLILGVTGEGAEIAIRDGAGNIVIDWAHRMSLSHAQPAANFDEALAAAFRIRWMAPALQLGLEAEIARQASETCQILRAFCAPLLGAGWVSEEGVDPAGHYTECRLPQENATTWAVRVSESGLVVASVLDIDDAIVADAETGELAVKLWRACDQAGLDRIQQETHAYFAAHQPA
jgi:hypothetical protein